jgi:DNA-binding HxlR family transcriptional regulator
MLGRQYETQTCSIARALEVVGERWSLLIVRDAFLGVRRFDDFQRDLGIARNVLQSRLELLIEEGVLEKRPYQEHPVRYEYRLTEKGTDLWPVIFSLMRWGDRYAYPDRPPVVLAHRGCGGAVDEHRVCTKCGRELEAGDVKPSPGPGATKDAPERHPALR